MIVNIHEAKTHLSKLIRRVILGEEIVIAKAGKPIAKLVPVESSFAKRVPGSANGVLRIGEDFDSPLPRDLQREFE